MSFFISKFSDCFEVFKKNLIKEVEANVNMQRLLKKHKDDLLLVYNNVERPFSKILYPSYKTLQFGDFFFKNLFLKINKNYNLKNYTVPLSKHFRIKPIKYVDDFLETNFFIDQYFGGLRNNYKLHKKTEIFKIPKFLEYFKSPIIKALRCYNDYKVLIDIENNLIPSILKDLFNYTEFKNVTSEAIISLKQLRNEKIKKYEALQKELLDIRKTHIKSIDVKNFTKVIKSEFEFSILFKSGNKKKTQHYSGIMEFIKNSNNQWICNNFTYEKL